LPLHFQKVDTCFLRCCKNMPLVRKKQAIFVACFNKLSNLIYP
jgi:hypothetical protein